MSALGQQRPQAVVHNGKKRALLHPIREKFYFLMDKMVSEPGRYQNNDYYKCNKDNVVFQPLLPVREEHVTNGLAAVYCEKKTDKTNHRWVGSRRIFGASDRSFNVNWTAI